jgi:ribokinase
MSGTVFVYGSINTDLVVYVTKLPRPGETVIGGIYASYPGGKGANQAVAAARTGAAVRLFGCLGEDLFGRERIASLEKTGVNTGGVRMLPDVASGVAQITVDEQGENTIAVAPGANMKFTSEGVSVSRPGPGETFVSLFQNEVPQEATEQLIIASHKAGHCVLWNIAPTLSRRPTVESLRALDYLVCNRNELAALTGAEGDPARAARIPLGWGVKRLIVTLGREGSIFIDPNEEVRIAAFPVDAVDTVGAGDCFCGVFAAGLAEGREVKEALHRASAAAAISATRKGAQPSMPNRAELEEFLASRGGW